MYAVKKRGGGSQEKGARGDEAYHFRMGIQFSNHTFGNRPRYSTFKYIPTLFLSLRWAGFSDLSDCQLMQMPDAVYHLMRDTPLVQCSLANNVIAKIPPKFPLSFSLLTGTYPPPHTHPYYFQEVLLLDVCKDTWKNSASHVPFCLL
jgi:hypothetical protein